MLNFLSTTAFLATLSTTPASASVRSLQYFQHGVECTPCADASDTTCTIKVKVNLFAGETGYFEIEGCEGINPTLLLKVGQTYAFDQSDVSNWYHLIGFAYDADGAHIPVDELEPTIPPGNSNCDETTSCPAPMYFMNGEYQGTYSNIPGLIPSTTGEDDFGLDAVEPLFFHPLGDWQSYGEFVTYLNFDDPNFDKDFFYFCHIHAGMSGRVKLIDANGMKLSPENAPDLPYEYHEVSEFDFGCGTYNLSDWRLDVEGDEGPGDMCPESFVCSPTELSDYAVCIEAMDCHMMASMTTMTTRSVSSLFSIQMIPHHQNAVNMAKGLLHAHPDALTCDTSGPVEEGSVQSWACDLIPILYDIVNVQNSQIIDMRDVLSQLGEEEFSNCEVSFASLGDLSTDSSRRFLIAMNEADKEQHATQHRREQDTETNGGAFMSAIECTPCVGTTGECEVVLKVNLFAGEHGYYTVDGCEGVNPTLLLSINRTYKFNQSDKTNWYHLIGFGYFPDGAHVGVEELEPTIPPPGSDSACADTATCPAPIYFMDGENQSVYNNIPALGTVTVGEDDFGLDAVEPLFFHPIGDWEEYGPFETYLNFDISYDQDIFYFCHIHAGMTGRIKLLDSSGNKLSADNVPLLDYSYDKITGQDEECGTYGIDPFQLPNDQCPDTFVCGAQAFTSVSAFANCVDSMNCAMLDGMSSNFNVDGISDSTTNDVILFIRQMIPHHQNAVNMAKALLKTGEATCDASGPVEEGIAVSVPCLLEPIVYGIINTQNRQIQDMEGILDAFGVAEENYISDCDYRSMSSEGGSVTVTKLTFVLLLAPLMAVATMLKM